MSRGQSLIELLIALGIFLVMVSLVTFLLIDSYTSNLQTTQNSQALFLVEEGLEAARSIRDNNWNDLIVGEHGLAISDGVWVFQDSEEDVSSQLKEGKRKIVVEEIDSNRRKVTAQVTWQLTKARPQEVSLVTYLTNWAQITLEDCSSYCQSIGYSDGICRPSPFWCFLYGETHEPGGDEYCPGGPWEDTCCCQP